MFDTPTPRILSRQSMVPWILHLERRCLSPAKKKDKLVHDLYVAAARNCGVTRQTFAELVPSLNCFFLPFAHTCTHTHVQPRKYTEFMAKSFARPRRSPISRCNNNIFVCIRPCPRLSLSVFPSRCLENPKLDTRTRSSRHP